MSTYPHPTLKDFTVEISIIEDDLPVRGNALASGDPKLDKEVEDEIIERLNRGDVWAWCFIVVTVFSPDRTFSALDTLGACSYKDEKEFLNDPYYTDMVENATRELACDLFKIIQDDHKKEIEVFKLINEYIREY